jgi:hypothetical protein
MTETTGRLCRHAAACLLVMSQGLGISEITALARETMSVAREHAGAETVDQVVNSVPGLSQFV